MASLIRDSRRQVRSVAAIVLMTTLGLSAASCASHSTDATTTPPQLIDAQGEVASESVIDVNEDVTSLTEDRAEPKVFTGTAREHVEATAACVERYGLVVIPGDANDFPSFGVSNEGVGQERVDEVLALCAEEVGEFIPPPATEASMTEQYNWLLGQYNCLVAAGFQMEPFLSLDSFLSQWRTNPGGFVPGSSPVELAVNGGGAYSQILAACPNSTEIWPS